MTLVYKAIRIPLRFLARRNAGRSGRYAKSSPRPANDPHGLIEPFFDRDFFCANYSSLAPDLARQSDDMLIDFYLSNAAAQLLDPNRFFSESTYLDLNSDVSSAVSRGEFRCGFHHWLSFGRIEGRSTRPSDRFVEKNITEQSLNDDIFRKIPLARWKMFIDETWYSNYLKTSCRLTIHPLKTLAYFVNEGLWKGHIPTDTFDEEFYLDYYEDVRIAKNSSSIPSGFAHYVLNGEIEGRVPRHDLKWCLRKKLGALAEPRGMANELALRHKLRPAKFLINNRKGPAINVFVPSLDPDLMFGGYIAYLHFLCRCSELGMTLRFIVTEDGQSNLKWFLRNIRPRWRKAFEQCEFVNIAAKDNTIIECSRSDLCIAYSAWTAHLADKFATDLNDKRFLYFIQEDERIFHDNGSLDFLVSSAYDLNYAAIFNSRMLEEHFRHSKFGVFAPGGATKRYLTFEHAIANIIPNLEISTGHSGKRLFVYCRPEGHAGRNLFEICVMVLRRCIETGSIDQSWHIMGLGSMGYEGEIDLGSNVKMKVLSRVDENAYERVLQSFDVGLSLMWAPHPSVVPYELAKAGVVCVTNTYGIRDKDYFSKFGFNIVAAEPSIDALCDAMQEAIARSDDINERLKGSSLPNPTSWDEVFTPDFIQRAWSLTDA